jgi:oligoendopeptidase F
MFEPRSLQLADAVWDLRPLVSDSAEDLPSFDDASAPGVSLHRLLDVASRLTDDLEASRGLIASFDSGELAAAMHMVGRVYDLLGRAGSYAHLDASTSSQDEAKGALVASINERSTEIANRLRFVDLEWAEAEEDHVAAVLGDPRLAFCAHHLSMLRVTKPFLLSESEERLLAQKAVTGQSAWSRFYDEQLGAVTVDFGDGPVSYEMVFGHLQSADRAERKAAAEIFTAALAPGLRTRAYIYNTLMADKAQEDVLRGFPTWVSSRNLANQATDASVAALVEAVTNRFEVARRWYKTKAGLLGLDRLADYDRMAPVGGAVAGAIEWGDAASEVLDAFSSFSPTMASHAQGFFTGHRIHAVMSEGKRGGAYCSPNVPTTPGHLFVNYTGTRNDVLTLAHELGHGVHFEMARPQGIFHHSTPLTVAETASVFAEEVTFGRLLAGCSEPAERLALLGEHVEGHIATVFRQVAMWTFEDLCHKHRRSEGELSVEAINGYWAQSQANLLGDTVEITPGYRTWWSYIPHVIHTPGYVYAYAFGQLLSLSVYQRSLEAGPGFGARYESMLAAGGSVSPETLAAMVGCDLTDPSFWDAGLDLVAAAVGDAESAAAVLVSK